jgi:pimeloyl-ACP methyl ester carboxylesterase
MKTFINNRQEQKVSVVIEGGDDKKKLAFVMHGLGGSKDQEHIRAMVEAFLENDYKVVSFDATNSFGESDGNYEDSTVTKHTADLEDVISWAEKQNWYVEPFILCGHSMGGMAIAEFAEKHPEKVKALAPISTLVTGELSFEAHRQNPERLGDPDQWKQAGIRISKSYDGTREKRLKWSHMEDRLTHDILKDVHKLMMPVLLAVGSKDDATPLDHHQILFNELPGLKELHVIEGALHSFYESHEREELKKIISKWVKKVDYES